MLLCQFHHDVCIHRRGWRLVLHPDGTTTAYGPDGQVLHSHSPPTLGPGKPGPRVNTTGLPGTSDCRPYARDHPEELGDLGDDLPAFESFAAEDASTRR